MSTFSPAFLEEIRNRLPLSGFVGSRLRLVRAGREFKGCCPFHNEKTPSFYINDDKQFFHCFGCGAHGDIIGFAMRHGNLSFPEAIENLAAQAGLQVPRDTPVEREKFDHEKHLHTLLERATLWFEEQLFTSIGREGLTYLHGRGLSDEAIRRFRLGYAPADAQGLIRAMTKEGYKPEDLVTVGLAKKSEDRAGFFSFFRNRVIFPVGDRRGRTVAFGARILGEGEPKYLNSPDHALFHKGQLLYGLSRARTALAQGQPLIVVEGYMDVIALVEAGYSGAVAPLGTALTEEQMQVLWRLLPAPENRDAARDYSPILCFDGDNAGLRAAARAVDRALPLLTPAQTLRIATMVGAKDPDELIRKAGKGAFDTILKQARPMVDMLWDIAMTGRAIRTPEEQGVFKAALRQRVKQIQDPALRELYGAEFKKRLDDAFGYKPKVFTPSNGKGNWKKNAAAEIVSVTRRPPEARRRATEKILLALMINHPALFDEFGEGLAVMDFQISEYEALRQKIIDHLSQEHDAAPTPAELRRALSAAGQEGFSPFDDDRADTATLDDILAPATYTLKRGAHPDAEIADARAAWQDIWRGIEHEQIVAEYNNAVAYYRDNPTDANKNRMEALQQRLIHASAATE